MTIATRLRGTASQQRRALVAALAVGPLVAPRRAVAQGASALPRIGVLFSSSPGSPAIRTLRDAFLEGMRELGWHVGTNVVVERRDAEQVTARLPELAAELVGLKVDLIVAAGTNDVIKAARDATSTIPIVSVGGINLVELGWVQSLRRPGGNLTGLMWEQAVEIVGKFPEVLREAVPGLASMGGIIDPTLPGIQLHRDEVEKAARKLGLAIHHAEVRTPDDLEGAFARVVSLGAQAVFVYGSNLTFARIPRFVELAARHRLADMYIFKEAVVAGGLMSYGVSAKDMYRRAARYVDRILKGANPAEMPIELPTKYEFVLNLKTARALGLRIPQSLLVRVDELVEQ